MKKLKIPFGLLNGRLVQPSEVQRGLACGCICPECKAKLIANHPRTDKVKYFSHYSSESCAAGYETAIHLAAKQVLIDKRRVLVPQISSSKTLSDRSTGAIVTATRTLKQKLVKLDFIEQEVRTYEGVIPDIVASVGGKLLFIEVAVTHFVDEAKKEKLEALRYPTLEIDLSDLGPLPSLADIENEVIYTHLNRKWVVNSKQRELDMRTELEAVERLGRATAEILVKRQREEEEDLRYKNLLDKEKLAVELKALGLDTDVLSPFIGHKVTGSQGIVASLNTWQAAIYRQFIHSQQWRTFNTQDVFQFLAKRFRIKDPFIDASKIAIYYYLQVLCQKNLICKSYGRGQYEVLEDASGFKFPFESL